MDLVILLFSNNDISFCCCCCCCCCCNDVLSVPRYTNVKGIKLNEHGENDANNPAKYSNIGPIGDVANVSGSKYFDIDNCVS